MPTRQIKESIWTSKNLAKCSPEAQLHFFFLLPLADDFGCFEASAEHIRGRCYPYRLDSVSCADIEKWNNELALNDLCGFWNDADRTFGAYITFDKHQRIRSLHRRKTPPMPPPHDPSWRQVTADDGTRRELRTFPNPNPNPIPVPVPRLSLSENASKLAKRLHDRVVANYPNSTFAKMSRGGLQTHLSAWATDFQRMLDKGYHARSLWDAIDRAQNANVPNPKDGFCWARVVQSPAKVEKHLDALLGLPDHQARATAATGDTPYFKPDKPEWEE